MLQSLGLYRTTFAGDSQPTPPSKFASHGYLMILPGERFAAEAVEEAIHKSAMLKKSDRRKTERDLVPIMPKIYPYRTLFTASFG